MSADVKSPRQGVDENLHAVLRAHRAGDGRNNGSRDRSMGDRLPPYVAGEKRKRAIAIATSLYHYGRPPVGCERALEQREVGSGRLARAACSARPACLLRTFSTAFVQAVIFAAAPLVRGQSVHCGAFRLRSPRPWGLQRAPSKACRAF